MGFFGNMFAMAQAEAEKVMNQGGAPSSSSSAAPTRWEKAVVGLSGIVKQVSKIDPDGVDVYCFGGGGRADVYRNIKDIKGLEGMVTAKEPSGECFMGAVLDDILNEAFERGFDASRPCSILVLTAGRPDDSDDLNAAIEAAAQKLDASGEEDSPLTITFVQVGDDTDAEDYLKYLDDNLATTNTSGDPIDIVDTIKDEEIKTAMAEFQESGPGTGGALFGAFAGAAMGVGGMYLYSQMNAKKRTEGWNGQWKATYDGEEIAVLTVKDDMTGNLEVEGFIPEDDDGKTTGGYMDEGGEDGGFSIFFLERGTGDKVDGTVEDEHNISWSDGTHWEEVPPEGSSWAAYIGAATAGAATGGATGYLLQKKFFKKASNKVPSDYIIVLDRSSKMAVIDTGK